VQLCNDLILRLQQLMETNRRKCVVLVDKAGSGKTNVACHTAEKLILEHPVILLSGQFELTSEYDIEFHIQKRLESQLGGVFSDWINRISERLKSQHKWLFIIIDGINENSNRPLFIKLLNDFLPKTTTRRIKLILTCRDLLWEPFQNVLNPYLFKGVINIANYDLNEWKKAVDLYFTQYNIKCELGHQAENSLKNPLLLRFFCEANQGQSLGRIQDIKLLGVFDLYLKKVNNSIMERVINSGKNSVVDFLMNVSSAIWDGKSTVLNQRSIEEIFAIRNINFSIYDQIIGENIIIEEYAHPYSLERSVRFLYDEFMEYVLARMLFEKVVQSRMQHSIIDFIIDETVNCLDDFPSALGAIFFLDQILKPNEGIVNKFIKACFEAQKLPQPTQLIYAFGRLDLNNLDDVLINSLESFYEIVSDEHKDNLATIILNILPRIPNHRFSKKYVKEVLEIHYQDRQDESEKKTTHHQERQDFDAKDMVDLELRLPAARYHYSEESKLNAIGLLIRQGGINDFDAITEGIERIGRRELNSALRALKFLDFMEDTPLFSVLNKYINMESAEYRIYSGWLLRFRYGKEPALFLFRLLSDNQTRVHEYAFNLFEIRLIEQDLLEKILMEIKKMDTSTWTLVYFIKLFAKRAQFRFQEKKEVVEGKIIETLNNLMVNQKSYIRLEVYRTCLEYPEYFDHIELQKKMAKDPDSFIQNQAKMIL
jgi:hypothetical protein